MDDVQLALQIKDDVLSSMESRPWVQRARDVARELLRANGNQPISIDDVYRVLPAPEGSPNQAGAVFRGEEFEMAGRTISSKRHGHGNEIKMWRLA